MTASHGTKARSERTRKPTRFLWKATCTRISSSNSWRRLFHKTWRWRQCDEHRSSKSGVTRLQYRRTNKTDPNQSKQQCWAKTICECTLACCSTYHHWKQCCHRHTRGTCLRTTERQRSASVESRSHKTGSLSFWPCLFHYTLYYKRRMRDGPANGVRNRRQ